MTLVEELKKRLVDEQQVRSRIDSEMCALHCEFAESELRTLHLTRAIAALADSASEDLEDADTGVRNQAEQDAEGAIDPADYSKEPSPFAKFMQREGATLHHGFECPIAVGDHVEIFTRGCDDWPVKNIDEIASHWTWADHPTDIIAYRIIEAPTDAERTSVVTDHDRVEQTNTDTVAAVEIPEGFIPWSGEDVFTPTPDSDDKTYSVEVLYRDGTRNINKAWTFVWGWKDNAESSSNIIAYKVISEPAEASEPAEIISTLTGDPAIEPESGLHDEQSQSDPITNPDASFWTAGFEEDRKPKPGFIEGAVSKLFGVKEPA